MGVAWNKRLILIMIAGIVTIAVFKRISDYNTPPELPKPAVINESLVTYYIGNMALDVPESWEMHKISAKFGLANNEEDSKTRFRGEPAIVFTDKPWSGDQRAVEKLKMELDFAEKEHSTPVKRQDVSEIFGRPAGMLTSEIGIDIQYSAPRPWYAEADPQITYLHSSLVLVEPQVILKFDYTEYLNWRTVEEKTKIIAAKQKMFSDWVLFFLSRYHWTGTNALPSDSYLSTGYGRIAVENNWPGSRYELTAHVSPRHAANKNPFKIAGNLSISFSAHKRLKNEYGGINRTVMGHAGWEIKYLSNRTKGLALLKVWKPPFLRLDLFWTDLSSGPFTTENPDIQIRSRFDSRQWSTQGIAHVLGVWDIVLNSVRPATANDSKE